MESGEKNCVWRSRPSVASLQAHGLPQERALLRLDGQYGTRVVLADLAGFSFVIRGKDYTLLDHPLVQARLHLPPDQHQRRPESQFTRALYDCPDVPVGAEGQRVRLVVATYPAGTKKSRVGVTRDGVVYALFLTNLPREAFTVSDVVELYLQRGAFEPTLADEDQELDPDRWCSHAPCGQEAWQIVSQWVWNLRLELGHQLEPTTLRTTAFAPAVSEALEEQVAASCYGPPKAAACWKANRFSGEAFPLQPDGTLRCPAGKALHPTEQRTEHNGSLRVLYAARIADCRACPLREQCQWHGGKTTKPRRVSLVFQRLRVGSAPLFWRDWSRRVHRRACMQLVRRQRIEVRLPQALPPAPEKKAVILSRARRAHSRLSDAERLARHARGPTAGSVSIRLFGVPDAFAAFLGLPTRR